MTEEQGLELHECMSCRKKVRQLFTLTGEDLQRERDPPIYRVCEACRLELQAMSRLESRYSVRMAIRDLLIFVPCIFAVLFLALAGISLVRGSGPAEVTRISFFLDLFTILTGINLVWNNVQDRYALTHNLLWSFRSRRPMISVSVCIAGVLFAGVAHYIPF